MVNITYISRNCDTLWHNIRWGSTNGVPTCDCGCDTLYILGDGRYKCKKCGKVFSDISGTILHHSRLPKDKWLCIIFEFAATPECSAITLASKYGINYKTAYMCLQKLRYLVGKDEISLSGVCRVDEAYIGAEWHNVHLRKKFAYMKDNGFMDKDSKRYEKKQLLQAVSAKKYHILSLIDEHNNTRLIHTPNPITKDIIKSIIFDKKNNISELITDESLLYKNIGIPVEQSNHSKHVFMTATGRTSNMCENRFSWVKRKWNGVFTHTSEKYLQLYLNQRQFHFNNSGKSVEDRFYTLAGLCAHNRVTNKDIFNFDYMASFPASRRKIEEEKSKSILSAANGIFAAVEDNYGRTYKR